MRRMPPAGLETLRQARLWTGFAVCWSVLVLGGCSGSKATPENPTQSSAADHGTTSAAAETQEEAPSQGQAAAKKKRPMVGDIPLDVWFDNPIQESKQTGPVAAPTASTANPTPPSVAATTPPTPPTTTPPTTPSSEPAASSSGGDDWATIVPLEDLQNEVKEIRLEMAKHLTSVQIYNGHYKDDIAADGTVLAALAGIALVHPEKVSWKDHAPQVRDMAAEMVKKAKGLGPKPFQETKQEFTRIDELLSGNPPTDLPESSADVPFSEVVSRRGIMKRLQKASDDLRANFQTEAALAKNQDKAAHTATIVAALTKVIGTEGYGNADEPEYQEFVKSLMEANLTMARAARDKDFAAFSEANGKVVKYCNECHSAYQSGN